MNFNVYQQKARETAIYPDKDNNIVYPVLGLVGEAGEVAEIIKKSIRDKDGKIGAEDGLKLYHELGDVLWYLSNIATELGLDLEEIAIRNIQKLTSRQKRDKIRGSGDFR